MKPKKYKRISEVELDRVAELRMYGVSISDIARDLGRAKSSISELIKINQDNRGLGTFRAALAARRRRDRKKKQRRQVRLDTNQVLLMQVYIGMVYLHRSPEQIVERLKKEYPHDMDKHISAETIYEYVYVRARGTLRADLIASLRRPQRHRDNDVEGLHCKENYRIFFLLTSAQKRYSPDEYLVTGRVISL